MEKIMEMATEFVKSIYSNKIGIADIRGLCGRYEELNYSDDVTISCGRFRQTLIPSNHKFIVKTGLVRGGVNQCKREMNIYNSAVEQGFGKYFAKCYGKFKVGACYFYVYEYVEGIGNTYGSATSHIKNHELRFFLHHNDINDLHSNNYAMKHNHVVLTDYSGYHYEDDNGSKTIYSCGWW